MTKQAKKPIRRKSVSLQDVAELSGVSIATASRILTGRTKSVPETARLVRQAATKLGYAVPESRIKGAKPLQPGLAHGQAALVIPDSRTEAASTPFTMALFKGVGEACSRHGVQLDMVHTNEDGSYPERLAIDGLILKNWPDDDRVIDKLPTLPTVLCMDTPFQDLPFDHVQFDLDVLAERMLRHLQEKGSKRVAVMTDMGQLTQRHTTERIVALADPVGIKAWSIAPPPDVLGMVTSTAIHELLAHNPLPDTVFCYGSDAMVLALQMTCGERGIRLGKDLDIVPVMVAGAHQPGMPCSHVVELPAAEMGKAAAELLFWRLANPKAALRRVLLAPEITP